MDPTVDATHPDTHGRAVATEKGHAPHRRDSASLGEPAIAEEEFGALLADFTSDPQAVKIKPIYAKLMTFEAISQYLIEALSAAFSEGNLTKIKAPAQVETAHILGMLEAIKQPLHQMDGKSQTKETRSGQTIDLFVLPKTAPPKEASSSGDLQRGFVSGDASLAEARGRDDGAAMTEGGKKSRQVQMFEAVSAYTDKVDAFALMKHLLRLPRSDLQKLETDAATAPNLFKIYQRTITTILEMTPIPLDEAALCIAIADVVLQHPESEALFVAGPYQTPGSFAFAAHILTNILPLSPEAARVIGGQKEMVVAFNNVWGEGAQYVYHVFYNHGRELRNRLGADQKAQMKREMQMCLHIAEQYIPTIEQLSAAAGFDLSISAASAFAVIFAIESVDRIADGDLNTFGFDSGLFKVRCKGICDALAAKAFESQALPELDMSVASRRLADHQYAVFGKDPKKATIPLLERCGMFHTLRRVRATTLELHRSSVGSARSEFYDTLSIQERLMREIIDSGISARYVKTAARFDGTLRYLDSMFAKISQGTSFVDAEMILRRADELLSYRLNARDLYSIRTKSQIHDTRAELTRVEFARLKEKAADYQNHSYSQFNRPTETIKGKWWPKDCVRWSSALKEMELPPSPVSTACSCNATMALIHLLTPDRSKGGPFPFDQVLDEGQVIYYNILKRLLGVDVEDTAGHYLRFEDLEADIFDKGYLVHVDGGHVGSRELVEVLSLGAEHINYARIFTQLEARIPPDRKAIGGLIQNGASIYAIHIDKSGPKTLYSIIDSHGLHQGIPTSAENYDRAFKVSFESIEDVAMFLKLHHPYDGDNIMMNTCTVLPVVGPKVDLVVMRDKGEGLLSDARTKSVTLSTKRSEGTRRDEDRSTLRRYGILPKTSTGSSFSGSLHRKSAPKPPPPGPPGSSSKSSYAAMTSSELIARFQTSKSLPQIIEIGTELKKKLPNAIDAISAYTLAYTRDEEGLKLLKRKSPIIKERLKIDPEIRTSFAKAQSESEQRRLIEESWKGYMQKAFALIEEAEKRRTLTV